MMTSERWAALAIGLCGVVGFLVLAARQPRARSGLTRAAQAVTLAIAAVWLLIALAGQSISLAIWGAADLLAAGGLASDARWARLLLGLLGAGTVAVVGLIALFSLALMVSEGRDLGAGMFGTGVFGVLNGWISLPMFALLIAGGAFMVLAAFRGSGAPGG